MPPEGEHTVPGFPEAIADRPTMPESVGLLFDPREYGTVGMVMGIRSDESITRTRAVLMRSQFGKEHYIKNMTEGFSQGNIRKVYPIYDWGTPDVWLAPKRFGWDYNTSYDNMERAGMSHHSQRCAPPYGEEPMRGLWTFACCFPDIWDRMQTRVPGAATAARLATTVAYSYGKKPEKPRDMSWEQFVMYWVNKHPCEEAESIKRTIAMHIKAHYKQTAEPILPTVPHPITGMTWEFLLMIAVRGDLKGRKDAKQGGDAEAVAKRREAYEAERRRMEDEGGEDKNPEQGDEAGRW